MIIVLNVFFDFETRARRVYSSAGQEPCALAAVNRKKPWRQKCFTAVSNSANSPPPSQFFNRLFGHFILVTDRFKLLVKSLMVEEDKHIVVGLYSGDECGGPPWGGGPQGTDPFARWRSCCLQQAFGQTSSLAQGWHTNGIQQSHSETVDSKSVLISPLK